MTADTPVLVAVHCHPLSVQEQPYPACCVQAQTLPTGLCDSVMGSRTLGLWPADPSSNPNSLWKNMLSCLSPPPLHSHPHLVVPHWPFSPGSIAHVSSVMPPAPPQPWGTSSIPAFARSFIWVSSKFLWMVQPLCPWKSP